MKVRLAIAAAALALVVAACADSPTELPIDAPPPSFITTSGNTIGIAGTGRFTRGPGSGVTVNVRLANDGSADGKVLLSGFTASVTVVVPPSGEVDVWCISGPFPDGGNFPFLLYIRDEGDGVSTFDEIAGPGGLLGASCASHPMPTFVGPLVEIAAGNFTGRL